MRRQRQQRSRGPREAAAPQASAPNHSGSARIHITHGVDLNTNLGEGFGPYKVEGESDVLPFVTSANIACGAHAGDPVVMEAALEEVKYYGLALGAHIGYPDLAGFGSSRNSSFTGRTSRSNSFPTRRSCWNGSHIWF